MDNLLKDFSLLGISALAVTIFVLSAFVRRAIEMALPELVKDERKAVNSKLTLYSGKFAYWYNEFILYLLPYLVASLLAIGKVSFIYGDIGTYTGRFFFAMLVATFSALIYKGVKKAIPALFGVVVEDDNQVLPTPPRL
jgi:hypothetical protein